MPSSAVYGKAHVALTCALWHKRRPVWRTLDIGPGRGTYAELLQALGVTTEMTGVEVWAPYVRQFSLEELYTSVVCGDARYIDWSLLGPFDLAFCGDVLEHMTKPEAHALVARLLNVCDVVVVSVPIMHLPQGEENGNTYEVHIQEDIDLDDLTEMSPYCVYLHAEEFIGLGYFAKSEAPASLLREVTGDAARLESAFKEPLRDSAERGPKELYATIGTLLRTYSA